MAESLPSSSTSNPIKEPSLDSGDFKVVYKELYQVRAKWRRIGIELNLAPGTLDAIEQKKSDPADWLEKVLTEWLNKETATWRELVDALRSAPVEETKLAKQLEQKYCHKPLSGTALPSGPSRKRKHDDEIQQLDSDIESMEMKFVDLQMSTRDSLKTRNVPFGRLADFLMNYSFFRSVKTTACSRQALRLSDQLSDLQIAESIDKIFHIISPFWSFLDFRILERIINDKDLGDDLARQNLAEYTSDLKEFLNSWKVKPYKFCRYESEALESPVKLHLKLDTDSLSIYRDVKAAIARIFGLKVEELQLHSIEEGCVTLVFLCHGRTIQPHLSEEKLKEVFGISPPILKISLVDESEIERIIFEREHYIKKNEVTSTDTPQSSVKAGSSEERPGWLQRFWTRIRPWSKANARHTTPGLDESVPSDTPEQASGRARSSPPAEVSIKCTKGAGDSPPRTKWYHRFLRPRRTTDQEKLGQTLSPSSHPDVGPAATPTVPLVCPKGGPPFPGHPPLPEPTGSTSSASPPRKRRSFSEPSESVHSMDDATSTTALLKLSISKDSMELQGDECNQADRSQRTTWSVGNDTSAQNQETAPLLTLSEIQISPDVHEPISQERLDTLEESSPSTNPMFQLSDPQNSPSAATDEIDAFGNP